MKDSKEVIEKLKEIKKGMTYLDMSMKLGMHQTSMVRWMETGRINPHLAELVKERIKKAKL